MWPVPRVYSKSVTILYIKDLNQVYNALDPIVFVDNTNLLILDKKNALFTKANLEMQKMNESFEANKLSLNTKTYTIKVLRKITYHCPFQY